jgi:subtilase family serine protease
MRCLSSFYLVLASSALLAQTPTPVVPPGSVPLGYARPTVWVMDKAPVPALTVNPKSGKWVNIDEMKKVYGLDLIADQGAGATIAIVDAFDSPNAELDLNTFSTLYGLPACTTANGCFTKVDQTGGASYPVYDSGWEVEINLDTQWVHAIAPLAKIILVEAASNYDSDLFTAEATAALMASVVSNSWSGGEYPTQSADWDHYMNQPYVTYLASSGDSGGFIGYPSTSSKVIAVGGTTLAIGPAASHYPVIFPVVETGWSGSGGGCSAYTPSLSYQKPLVPTICKKRAVPDISMDADPNSGVLVLVSLQGGYYRVGGTSLACPMMAAVVGIANGVRQTGGKLALSNTLQHLYDHGLSPTYVRDITVGKAGLWPFVWNSTVGFDFVTGLGVPVANNLVPYLVSLP